MKKLLKTGKKALSVIMAVLMVMTAWVWVAPEHASAAAGKYYVRVYISVKDYGNLTQWGAEPKEYTGPSMSGISSGITLYHKDDNGTATTTKETHADIVSKTFIDGGSKPASTVYETVEFSNVGFPESIQFYAKDNLWDYVEWYITKITVASGSSATEHTIWSGEVGCAYGGNSWQGEISPSGFTSHRKGSGTWTQTSDTSKWIYPYANTFIWSPTTLSAMTCPKTASDASATQKVSVTAKDQYGVQMFDPIWSVKGETKSDGITVDPSTKSLSTTINITSSANILNTTNSQTGTVTATWSTPNSTGNTSKTSSNNFTINDATYTATFKNHRDADGVLQNEYTTTAQYGVIPTAPVASNYSQGDYDYTFAGWSPSADNGISADTTYTAVYNQSDKILAVYTAVNEAIAEANAIKTQYGTEYELKYTIASRVALEQAITAVVTGLGRSQQSTVDGYAKAINDAIDGLEPNKFAVIFLDKNGAIIKYEKDAEYKSTVNAPDFPEEQKNYHDATNHYTYTGWDTNEYTSVLDDLVIAPVYTAEPHNFESETVSSTCVQSGTTKHTCQTCGYTYYDGGDELGDHVWRADYTVDVEPTCVLPGSKSIHCTLCDAQKDITAIEPKGHNWESYTVAVNPTCTNIGISTRVCAEVDCKFCEHLVIEALRHDYKKTTVAPTCTAKGYDEYVCQNDGCGHSYRDNYTDIVAHTYGAWVTVSEAHCGVAGVKKQTCTECGYINIGSIDALEHNLSGWTDVVEQTCTGKGYQVKTCSECTNVIEEQWLDALGHNYVVKSVVDPSCTGKGYTLEECDRENCGAQRITNETPALDHSFVVKGTVDATCMSNGYTLEECACGAQKHTNETDALGHDWTEWTVDPSTNSGEGSATRSCKRANCNETETVTIPAGGHTFNPAKPDSTTAASCTSGGTATYKCTNHDNCGIEITIETAALGHDFSGTESNVVDATCTEDGSKTVKCIRCDETTDVIIPHKGHTWGNWNITTPATNTTPGEMTRTCSNNKCTDTVVIPAGGHIWDNGTETLAPTCTKTGTIVYKCTAHANCGVKIEVTLPMLQHNYTTEYVDSTCDRAGYIRTSCTVCKKLIVDKSISPKAHTFDNGTKYPATCTDAAYHLYQCINTDAQGKDNCNYSYKAFAGGTDAALGHNLVAGETTATCEGTGSQIFYCDRENCGYSTSVEMPALGHNYEAQGDVVSATCTAPATQVYKCTACNAAYTKLVEAEKGHSFGNWTVTQDATTDKFGIQERSCSVCGYVEYDKIAPIGNHVFKEEILSSATCTTDGMISYTCTVATHGTCSANYTKTIPATGHTEAFAYEAATCSKGGFAKMYCSTCTTVLSEQKIDKLGCDWVQGEVTSSTCSTKGSIAYECSRCGSDKSVELSTNENAHQYETKVTNATCYKEGSVVTKCKLCQNKLSEETLIKTEHTWDDGTETTPATCTTKGEKTYKCTVEGCTATKTEPIDALGHDWGNWFVEKASTNTDKGEMKRTCNRQNCNAYETHEIPAGGHEWDEGEVTKEATCTSTGTKVYSCKNHTGDNACGITFTVTLDKLQHTLTTSKTDATCTKNGEVVTKCKNCNTTTITTIIPATGHNYKPGEEVEATCDKSGYKTYKCDNCNETYNEINGNAKGHNYTVKVSSDAKCLEGGKMVLKCADCDTTMETAVPALGHDYKKISSTDATCAAAATETYKCSRCEASYTVSVGDKLTDDSAHDWSTWTVVVEATEASIGYKTRECRICHKLKIDTIDATGEHKFEDGKVVEGSRVDPTCTDNGHETRKCSVHEDCGETAVVTIPATGHAEEKIVAVAATCTTDGSSEGSKCTKCGTVLVAPVTLPKLGHAWGNEKVTPATCKAEGKIEYICTRANCNEKNTVVIGIDNAAHNLETTVAAATCTENGSVTVSCKNEGCTYSEVVEIILAKGHSFTGKETLEKAASCTENGSKTVQCASCNVTDTIVLPKLGHNMVKGDKVDATCTTSGYTPYICDNKDCDHSYRVYDEAVVEHNYVQVEGSSTATCLAGGTVTMQCSVCKDEITAAVPALGHSYGDWSTINPTASTEGSKTRECSICKTKETVILPALGHEMVKDEAASTKASCTAEGTDVYVCTTHTGDSACGYTYSVKVPVIAHNYDESIDTKVTTVAPTCTENGSKTVECKDCNATVTTVIPRTGHTMSTTVTEATCEAEGSVVTKCTADGCTYKLEDKVLAKKPHTISIAYAYPGCTIEGYVKEACDKCDYEKILSTTPALGHSYTEDVEVTKPAGCLEPGKKTVKCSRCTATTEVDIPATGHDYQPGEEVEATCIASGYVPYSCQNEGCSSSYNNLTSNPNGHKWSTQPEDGEIKVTCEIDGKATYKCEKCEATNVVITPKFGHSWTPWTVSKAPTANSTGESTRTCLREGCSMVETLTIPALGESVSFTVSFVVEGKLISTQKVSYGSAATAPEVAVKAPDADYHYSFSWDTDFAEVTADLTVNGIYTATGHTYGEWITDIPAGCNNSGLRHRVCACGYIDEDVVAKLSHDFSEVIEEKPATCTENGYRVVVCKNCGAEETQTLKRLGHSMTYYSGYAATCDSEGIANHYNCSRCGKDFEDKNGIIEITSVILVKKYHTFVVVDGSTATCTSDGVTDYKFCTMCGYVQHSETIPAYGHTDADGNDRCDRCGILYENNGALVCSCNCHKKGTINELFYKILLFFWKLFGINKSCDCGTVHY